jgi:hypothetical protein
MEEPLLVPVRARERVTIAMMEIDILKELLILYVRSAEGVGVGFRRQRRSCGVS